MFKKIVITSAIFTIASSAMSVSTLQDAPKNQLGCIKGLGKKRVESIVSYRSTHTIDSLNELLNIRGIGKAILKNIKTDIKKKKCTTFNQEEKEKKSRKKNIKAE